MKHVAKGILIGTSSSTIEVSGEEFVRSPINKFAVYAGAYKAVAMARPSILALRDGHTCTFCLF